GHGHGPWPAPAGPAYDRHCEDLLMRRSRLRSHDGFSLVEVLIAMTVFLLILLGVFQVFAPCNTPHHSSRRKLSRQQHRRLAPGRADGPHQADPPRDRRQPAASSLHVDLRREPPESLREARACAEWGDSGTTVVEWRW